MNAYDICEALGGIRDEFVKDARAEIKTNEKSRRSHHTQRGIIAAAALAACFCLILTGALHVLYRLDYFAASCGAGPGIVAEGVYYYSVPHDGVYRYEPGSSSEKLLGKYFYDSWNVDGYGLYYARGRSLYVIPHESGRTEKLYTADGADKIGFSLELDGEGTVTVTEYDKKEGARRFVLIDKKTGHVIRSLGERPVGETPDKTEFRLGGRTLTLTPEKDSPVGGTLTENGNSLLPDGQRAYIYPLEFGDNIILFPVIDPDSSENDGYYVARADGTGDNIITIDGKYLTEGATEDGEYLFASSSSDNEIVSISTRTGEVTPLPTDCSHEDFCDLATDGVHLYTCAPWSETQTCWRIVYKDGAPASLEFVGMPHAEK